MELLPAYQPYDARRVLWYLGLHAVPGLETYRDGADGADGARYARTLPLAGGPGVVRVSVSGNGFAVELTLSDPADESDALARVAQLLDLAGDPAAAVRQLGRDDLLGPLVDARPGVRVPGSADHVETLVGTIIGQQISLAGARTVTGRVVAALGTPLPPAVARYGVTHAFPTAAALAAADPEQLPMPRARGRSLVAVARALLDRGDALASGSPQTRADLLALPGVGPWTAAYVALRCGRDPDVFLPTDLAVQRALESHGLPADPASARALSASWSPYRSLALMHLWTHLLEGRAGLSGPAGRLSAC